MNETNPSADALDRYLTASLSARPELPAVPNLAERAITRARALDRLAAEQKRAMVLHRWRLRFIYATAAMLIGVLIAMGGNRLLSERQSMARSDDSNSMSESTTSSTGTTVLWLGGLLFVCTLAGLATESAITPGRVSLLA